MAKGPFLFVRQCGSAWIDVVACSVRPDKRRTGSPEAVAEPVAVRGGERGSRTRGTRAVPWVAATGPVVLSRVALRSRQRGEPPQAAFLPYGLIGLWTASMGQASPR
ncbi:hypothetical protein GCM10009662_29370 [Catellatospora coxensis]|uniref:Uncharacterized protein n=1 Tax=Catellatospora coxensis TaxID=310354 RepID=A0A8J3L3Y1_9ACTN|nr:hypothetical protein Cco03nite_76790 [Catellatospora coxensis]